MIEPHASEILSQLKDVGALSDGDIDLFHTALLIASIDHPGRLMERYTLHKERVVQACRDLIDDTTDTAEGQLRLLRNILVEQEEYSGDTENYDRLDNADLMSVVDRREGLPIALSIIYMSVGEALGWDVQALSFPAHVFLRIQHNGERIIFDPFDDAKIMEAHDLRHKLKELVGDHIELSASYYEPMSRRDVLVRLQNNIKTRLIAHEDYDMALQRIDILRLIVPYDPRLLFESGVLSARAGQRQKAIELLYDYVDMVDTQDDKDDALMLLRELENGLN